MDVVHVTSREKQQEVNKLFTGVAGLTAMGTSTDGDYQVVIGSVGNLKRSALKVLISDVDPDAVLTTTPTRDQRAAFPAAPRALGPSH